MPEKCQGYSFYRFNEFLRENQQGKGEGGKLRSHPDWD